MTSAPSTAPRSSKETKAAMGEVQSSGSGPGVSLEPQHSPVTSEQDQNGKLVKKKEELRLQIEGLQDQIGKVQAELDDMNGRLGGIDASARVQRHIKLLHQYNEIKDIGTGLFGVIAEHRGVRVKDVFEEFEIGDDD